jgi:hypothetical protein
MRRTASEILNDLNDLEMRVARLKRTASAKEQVIHTEYPLGARERPTYTNKLLSHRQIVNLVLESKFNRVTVEDDEAMFHNTHFFGGGSIGNLRVMTKDGMSLALYVKKFVERKGQTLEIQDWREG